MQRHHAATTPTGRSTTSSIGRPLDAHTFRNAVSASLLADPERPFTLVVLRAIGASAKTLWRCCLDRVTLAEGDLVGLLHDGIGLLLRAPDTREADHLVAAARRAWRVDSDEELDVDIASYPREEHRVMALLRAERAS